jgi:hypothetical protein
MGQFRRLSTSGDSWCPRFQNLMLLESQVSSVSIVTIGTTDLDASRPALGSIQPPIKLVPGAIFPRIKLPGRDAGHSNPSSPEVKNVWICASTPPVRLHGVVLS